MVLLGLFAAVALALAAVGIFGVRSFFVTQRTREIGIRMALGAGRAEVMRLVVGRGALLAGVGIGLGIAGALWVTRWMRALLFGVPAHDPLTFAVVVLVLAGTALLASYLPARRATRVDPMVARRGE
jgi:ABC-type antimicrobial peptide transport system permease subunit